MLNENVPVIHLQGDESTFTYNGNFSKVRSVWRGLPLGVQALVLQAGFGPLLSSFPEDVDEPMSSRCDRRSMQALMERWFDTTHTFQLPCGEFTLSPASFSAITGLSCAGERIFWDGGIYSIPRDAQDEYISRMLGVVPGRKSYKKLYVNALASHLSSYRPEFEWRFDQMARAFILYLLGSTIFCDTNSTVGLHFIPILRDFDQMRDYDWGSPALAYLFHCMDKISRGAAKFCGFWHATHVSDFNSQLPLITLLALYCSNFLLTGLGY